MKILYCHIKKLLTASLFVVLINPLYSQSSGLFDFKSKNNSLINSNSYPVNFYHEIEGLNYDPFKTKIDYGMLAGVGAVTLVSGVGIHIYQYNSWWKDRRRSFHFAVDYKYALLLDKAGHFYAGSLLAHGFSSALEASNIQSEQAAIYGSLLALLYHTYVEIEDGFGAYWGFDYTDQVANALGAGYTLAQYYVPFLKNFMFRFSYLPTNRPKYGFHPGGGIDDYEGQKYWLSLRMKNLLPEVVANYWPEFLMISAGVSVKNLNGSGGGYREIFLALDIDAETIPLYGGFWQFLKNTLNYIHFPMPGVRITPDAAFFVFCF